MAEFGERWKRKWHQHDERYLLLHQELDDELAQKTMTLKHRDEMQLKEHDQMERREVLKLRQKQALEMEK
jgi:hypothetical protein